MPSRSTSRALFVDLAAAGLVVVAVFAIGLALGVWTGFPKGTDAYSHLTRLKFVADSFPHHEWLYAWSAGMPAFETYPELPYLLAAPVTSAFGAQAALRLLAFVAMLLLGLGTYGTVRGATGSHLGALVSALGAVGSMATWTWIVNGGVYARVLAAGLAACACWAAARWLGGSGRIAFALTAVILAAAIASHQFVGAVFALGIGIATLAHPAPARLRRAAHLALATFLLASPAIVPALVRYGGFASTFLGLDRPQLTSPLTVLTDPRHIGIAVIPVLLLGLLAAWPASRAVWLSTVGAIVWLAYLFAPSLGIPSRLYYVNGIEPFSTTFMVALAAALAGGFALGVARSRTVPRWRRRGAAAIAVLLVAANAVIGTDAFLAGRGYPKVEDTAAATSVEALARRTITLNGDDLTHRFLPATASESVWFSYIYAKPQLRDYYLQGVVHPDWLAWANAAIYTPPFHARRFHAALDWFAVDAFSVFDDPNFTGNLGAYERDPSVRLLATSEPPLFREYGVRGTGAIWRPTNAPLVVVVGGREEYDTVARMLFDRVGVPSTLIPIWWQGTADGVPPELVQRAQAVVIEDGRFGDRAAAERTLEAYANSGGRVLLDARGASASFAPLWPIESSTDEAIPEWSLRAASADVRIDQFAPASYEGGPWGAPVATALRTGARAILRQGDRPLVAERAIGNGAVVWVGGNLFYHAKSKASDVEADFLVGLLGPATARAPIVADSRRLDPERVAIRLPGAAGVFVSESYHPKWTARWSDGSARTVYYAGPGLIYVPVPAGEGTLTLEFGRSWTDYAVWVLVLIGALMCAWPLVRR
ncbi:MAG TPA: hypothetical protein VGR87_14260 [Candidatus Limnocylindria bacterium]|nr:hypothetical protein [Candidatus Limnocylindria bacterium]